MHRGLPARRSFSTRHLLWAAAFSACAGRGGGPAAPAEGVERVVSAASAARLGLEVEAVAPRARTLTRWLGGRLAPLDTRVAHVTSPVAGRVLSLDAPVGARVGRGELLARIASAEVAEAAGDQKSADAERDIARLGLRRQRALAALGATSQQEVEGARDRLQVAMAESERAAELVRLLGAAGAAADARILRLTSPIAGEVIARGQILGQFVQGGLGGAVGPELFTIADLDRLWVEVDLHADDLAAVAVGTRASAWPLSGAHAGAPLAEGTIGWVGKIVDARRHAARAHMEVANPGGALHPFAPVRVRVEVPGGAPLSVARRAVHLMGGKTVVFTRSPPAADGGAWALTLRPVVVDAREAGDHLAVLFGLEAGALAVIGRVPTWPVEIWRSP